MKHKEQHPRAIKIITSIDHHFGTSLTGKEGSVYRFISKCNLCENKYIQFFYDEEDMDDSIVGDVLLGGQQYSG